MSEEKSAGLLERLLRMAPKPTHQKYRILINRLIELFEQIRCKEKERIIGAIAKVLMIKTTYNK